MRKLRLFLRNSRGFKGVYKFVFWLSNDVVHWKRILLRMYGRRILRAVDEIIRRGNLPVTPYYGTLLGLVRDGCLIRHDDDMDYAVFARDFKLDKFYAELKEVGFYFERFETVNDCLTEFCVRYKEISVDFFFLAYDRSRGVRFSLQKLGDDYVRYEYPDACVYSEITCCGEKLRIVNDSERYLDLIYGQWRVVDKSWHGKKSPANKGSVKGLDFKFYRSRNEGEWESYVARHKIVHGELYVEEQLGTKI